jgi:hypothetical protein
MSKKARSHSKSPHRARGTSGIDQCGTLADDPYSDRPNVQVTDSRERKWWEVWWGISIISIFTTVAGGLILSRIDHSRKPAAPSDSASAEMHSRAQDQQPGSRPDSRGQEIQPGSPPALGPAPQKTPQDRNVIRPSAVAHGPDLALLPKDQSSQPVRVPPPPDYIAKAYPPPSSGRMGHFGGGTTGKPRTVGKPILWGMESVASQIMPPGRTVALAGGGRASIRANGQVRSIDRNGIHIEFGIHGGRTVVSEHNGALVVSTGNGVGYVQRPYIARNGHTYVSRTYVDKGRIYVRLYRSYHQGGKLYYSYYPAVVSDPKLVEWAYNPWPGPIAWSWGWGGAPWYGYYSGYFAPYPVYPSGTFWLTDHVLADNLSSAYRARANGTADAAAEAADSPEEAAGSGTPLTPEIKQSIAEEVKAQLAAEASALRQGSAASETPPPASKTEEVLPALDPAVRTFIVSGDLTVVASGRECLLTSGDVITRITDAPDQHHKVTASVNASKRSDCAAGSTVAVSLEDLQEMQNHFREDLDAGIAELAKKQGTGGMPKAPDTDTKLGDIPLPLPDATAEKALEDQRAVAQKIIEEVRQEINASSTPPR